MLLPAACVVVESAAGADAVDADAAGALADDEPLVDDDDDDAAGADDATATDPLGWMMAAGAADASANVTWLAETGANAAESVVNVWAGAACGTITGAIGAAAEATEDDDDAGAYWTGAGADETGALTGAAALEVVDELLTCWIGAANTTAGPTDPPPFNDVATGPDAVVVATTIGAIVVVVGVGTGAWPAPLFLRLCAGV